MNTGDVRIKEGTPIGSARNFDNVVAAMRLMLDDAAYAEAARGLLAQYDRHVRIARWTFPIWLYVSVTGVVIYLMLYRLS